MNVKGHKGRSEKPICQIHEKGIAHNKRIIRKLGSKVICVYSGRRSGRQGEAFGQPLEGCGTTGSTWLGVQLVT